MMQRGFTLLELLVVIVILTVLIVIVLPGLSNFRNSQILRTETENIISVLNEARSQTLSSENSSQYGIHFQNDKIVLFEGSVYSSISGTNVDFEINPALTISDISLNGGSSDLVFERINGDTDEYGTVTLEVNSSKQKVISISQTGVISSN